MSGLVLKPVSGLVFEPNPVRVDSAHGPYFAFCMVRVESRFAPDLYADHSLAVPQGDGLHGYCDLARRRLSSYCCEGGNGSSASLKLSHNSPMNVRRSGGLKPTISSRLKVDIVEEYFKWFAVSRSKRQRLTDGLADKGSTCSRISGI